MSWVEVDLEPVAIAARAFEEKPLRRVGLTKDGELVAR
jgi:hypothetical protein